MLYLEVTGLVLDPKAPWAAPRGMAGRRPESALGYSPDMGYRLELSFGDSWAYVGPQDRQYGAKLGQFWTGKYFFELFLNIVGNFWISG